MICELRNIQKKFEEKTVFKNFNLSVKQGDFIGITGNSGSGKSTLLNMMGLLESPDEGIINMYDKQNVKPNTRSAQKLLRHKIGFLFQNFALIDDKSVNYNLDIACLDKKHWNKTNKMQLLDKLRLDVPLNKKAYHLSGGEQQRLALARLMIKDCDLILADEPTGSLDQTNRNAVLDVLSQLNRDGKTIVVVSHDPFVIEQCQKEIKL